MTRILFISIILLQVLGAQPSSGDSKKWRMPGIGVISGEVVYAETGTPLEYASVTLFDKKSNDIITGLLTDDRGLFVFQEIRVGDYFIEINFMGIEPWISEEIHISKKNKRINIGRIEVTSKFIEAASVDIKDTKEIYEFETDKIVYNPENDIIASAGSAEDVLSNAPMVTVDQDGEVQLRGKSNVNILVDGRKNRIDLANIAGSQIEKVEVITSPSAKYDPEGMAGIINIVLKKGSTDGFTGNIKINGNHNKYHTIDKMNGFNIFGNYRKGPLNLFSSVGLSNKRMNRSGYRNTITTYMDTLPTRFGTGHLIYGPDIVDSLFYSYENKTERSNLNFRFGVDYFFKNNLTLTSEFKISNHTKIDSAIQTFTVPAFNPEISVEEEGTGNPNFDLEYLFILEKEFRVPDQELKFSFSIDKGEDNEINTLLFQNKKTEFTDFHNGAEIDFSYKTPFLSNQKIEFGYDGTIIGNESLLPNVI